MGNLGYKAIDVDNHYYEPLDAFTRHLDKKFRRRGVQMFSDGKHTQAVIGDRVNRFIPNPTFDPIIVPGCLDLLFRGEIPGRRRPGIADEGRAARSSTPSTRTVMPASR